MKNYKWMWDEMKRIATLADAQDILKQMDDIEFRETEKWIEDTMKMLDKKEDDYE